MTCDPVPVVTGLVHYALRRTAGVVHRPESTGTSPVGFPMSIVAGIVNKRLVQIHFASLA